MNIDFQEKSEDLRKVIDWLSTAAAELLSRAEKSEHELAECRVKLADFENKEKSQNAVVRYTAELKYELEAKKKELSEREESIEESEQAAADKLKVLEQQEKDNQEALESEKKRLKDDFAGKKNELIEHYRQLECELEQNFDKLAEEKSQEVESYKRELERKYYTDTEKYEIDAATAEIQKRNHDLEDENKTQRETIEDLLSKKENQPESENTAEVQELKDEIERLKGVIADQKNTIKLLQLQKGSCFSEDTAGASDSESDSFADALRQSCERK